MAAGMTRDEFGARLVRAGELEVSAEKSDEVEGRFSPDFTFHGPGGRQAGYDGLRRTSVRSETPSTTARSSRHRRRRQLEPHADHHGGRRRARVHTVTGPLAAALRPARRIRPDQYLPVRRRRPNRRRVHQIDNHALLHHLGSTGSYTRDVVHLVRELIGNARTSRDDTPSPREKPEQAGTPLRPAFTNEQHSRGGPGEAATLLLSDNLSHASRLAWSPRSRARRRYRSTP